MSTDLARLEHDQPQQTLEVWTPQFSVTVDDAIERKKQKRRFFKDVMDEDLHFGKIPGTGTKPTLLKPGAEMLLSNQGLSARMTDEVPPILDYDGSGAGHGEPLIAYRRVCRIYRQLGTHEDERMLVAEFSGSCSSRETKYRYRNMKIVCPECKQDAVRKSKEEWGGGWYCNKKAGGCGASWKKGDPAIESQEIGKTFNPDIADLENTILKMADKRALVAATLVATGCSDIFTQDVEDADEEKPDSRASRAPAEAAGTQTLQTPAEAAKPQPAQAQPAKTEVQPGAVADHVLVTPAQKAGMNALLDGTLTEAEVLNATHSATGGNFTDPREIPTYGSFKRAYNAIKRARERRIEAIAQETVAANTVDIDDDDDVIPF